MIHTAEVSLAPEAQELLYRKAEIRIWMENVGNFERFVQCSSNDFHGPSLPGLKEELFTALDRADGLAVSELFASLSDSSEVVRWWMAYQYAMSCYGHLSAEATGFLEERAGNAGLDPWPPCFAQIATRCNIVSNGSLRLAHAMLVVAGVII